MGNNNYLHQELESLTPACEITHFFNSTMISFLANCAVETGGSDRVIAQKNQVLKKCCKIMIFNIKVTFFKGEGEKIPIKTSV